MSGLNLKKMTVFAGVAALALASTVDAQAFWRHRGWGSSGGSWGSWGSSGGSSGSWGSSGGSWGSSGGHWGSSGSWGSSGGYYYASSGGSSGSWGSSGGSSGGSYGYGGYSGYQVNQPVAPPAPPAPGAPAPPAPPATEAPADNAPPAPEGAEAPTSSTMYPVDQDSVMLSVWVPADAKVFVNGNATTSTGSERHYVSRGLRQGANYAYEIRAEVVRDGRTVSETKQVVVTGGQRANVQFDINGASEQDRVASQPTKTTLLLRVPANAKVFLAGRETKSTGEEREFTTTKLPQGAAWENYAVRVELERNGETLTKDATLTLTGGQTRELSVDFDTASVAQR